jgi:hypothetical protein
MIIIFTKSPQCKSRFHCQTCRDKEGGREWRESLRKAFLLPNDETDFECPHGLPWGCGPQTGSQKEYQEKLDADNKRIEEIGQICEACDEKYDCDFVQKSACARKRMIRERTAVCPLGKW